MVVEMPALSQAFLAGAGGVFIAEVCTAQLVDLQHFGTLAATVAMHVVGEDATTKIFEALGELRLALTALEQGGGDVLRARGRSLRVDNLFSYYDQRRAVDAARAFLGLHLRDASSIVRPPVTVLFAGQPRGSVSSVAELRDVLNDDLVLYFDRKWGNPEPCHIILGYFPATPLVITIQPYVDRTSSPQISITDSEGRDIGFPSSQGFRIEGDPASASIDLLFDYLRWVADRLGLAASDDTDPYGPDESKPGVSPLGLGG